MLGHRWYDVVQGWRCWYLRSISRYEWDWHFGNINIMHVFRCRCLLHYQCQGQGRTHFGWRNRRWKRRRRIRWQLCLERLWKRWWLQNSRLWNILLIHLTASRRLRMNCIIITRVIHIPILRLVIVIRKHNWLLALILDTFFLVRVGFEDKLRIVNVLLDEQSLLLHFCS